MGLVLLMQTMTVTWIFIAPAEAMSLKPMQKTTRIGYT